MLGEGGTSRPLMDVAARVHGRADGSGAARRSACEWRHSRVGHAGYRLGSDTKAVPCGPTLTDDEGSIQTVAEGGAARAPQLRRGRSSVQRCPCAWGFPSLLMELSAQVTSSIGLSLDGGAPGTPGACITLPPAPTPCTLTLRGGFSVLDSQQNRLHDRAIELGFTDLGGYLQARCQQQASPAQLASELATTAKVVRRLLDQVGITASARQVTAARGGAPPPTITSLHEPRSWASRRCGRT